MGNAVELGKTFIRKFQDDDAMGAAAEMAFRFMFALFPLLIFLAALSSYVARWIGIENPTQELLQQGGDALPADVRSVLEPQLNAIFQNQAPGLLTLTAVLALWAASAGTKTIMKVLNRVYEVEEARPFIRKQAVGVGITLGGGLVFLAAAIVLVVGQAAGQQIADALGIGGAWSTVVTIARIPVVLVLIAVAVGLVYWVAPNADLSFKWVTWGGSIFVVLWLVATLGFGFYVANFGNYNATYGSLGAVIILMTWLYFSSLLLIVGAQINFLLERRFASAEESEVARREEQRSRAIDAATRPASEAR